jgi:hypothetical protein
MAYDAVVAGARGLFFFGGQLTQIATAADRRRGWNWTYWRKVQKPLLQELTDSLHTAALTAPEVRLPIAADAPDIALSARAGPGALYLIAVRKSPTASGRVRFSGLPASIGEGTVLPHPGGNPARRVTVKNGSFVDPSPYRPHNARVYSFPS